jgi:histidine ammonia-lyase
MNSRPTLLVNGSGLTTRDVESVARGEALVSISDDHAFQKRLRDSRQTLEIALEQGKTIYGISTGFGDSVSTRVQPEAQLALARNLARYHRIGVGPTLTQVEARAVMFGRLVSLGRAMSAVRPEVLQHFARLLNEDVIPAIPSRGSVGASGDLTPLAYVAAALTGEGSALQGEGAISMAEAYQLRSLSPIELDARETLAVMNGTSAMAGLGALAVERTYRFLRWATALSALTLEALGSDAGQFSPRIASAKGHPGSVQVAEALTDDLTHYAASSRRLQERYSVRCSPQVIGIALDICNDAQRYTEGELNGASDNPLFDPDGSIFHGGNFYGGHICQAMDALHAQLASVGDLLERQLILLCTPTMSEGLSANLVQDADRHPERHGFKAAQITASALVAEAIKSAIPASLLSRSTENHNQDKVSMGMLATRTCLDVLVLLETVAAIHTLAVTQALELRTGSPQSKRGMAMLAAVRREVATVRDDRPMDVDVDTILRQYQRGELSVGDTFQS